MKSLSNLIHRVSWPMLIVGGMLVVVALAAFVTPFHVIDLRNDGASAEEKRAIKREIDNTLAEGALDVSRQAILAMRGATSDPQRREELNRALEELDRVREDLRQAGAEVLAAKREAVDTAREAVREATTAIEEARQSANDAMKLAGVENSKVRESLDRALAATKEAEEEAKAALAQEEGRRKLSIGLSTDKDKPLIDIEIGKSSPEDKTGVSVQPPAPPAPPVAGSPPAPPAPPAAADAPAPPEPPSKSGTIILPSEVREQIRRDVNTDIRKIGIGAGLILIFIPLFILTVVAKIFIDRSRAAMRLAELKKKEAEYSRMSQQVTEAKLQALQAQVEPHFLYNTLANVRALTEVDPQRAGTMVDHLIAYLRNALPKMRESISTVGQEIELVRAYLNILQMRMGKRLAFDIAVPSNLTGLPFPPLMLPSLVENAIKHGLEPQREGGSVHISAQSVEGRLRLTVADTGRGFGDTVGNGVGLSNLRERLAALYGEGAKLTLEANPPTGVIATIDVPVDGMRASAPGGPAPDPASQPAQPATAARKVFSAVGTAERVWRKSLSFAFVGLVVVLAIVCGLAIGGIVTGVLPVQVGDETMSGAGGALIGTAGILLAFCAVVLVLAAVLALVYGLGFMFAGLAIFIPVVVLVAVSPALAPLVLLALVLWWLIRRGKRQKEAAAAKVEPKMAEPAPAVHAEPIIRRSADTPPPIPPEEPPRAG